MSAVIGLIPQRVFIVETVGIVLVGIGTCTLLQVRLTSVRSSRITTIIRIISGRIIIRNIAQYTPERPLYLNFRFGCVNFRRRTYVVIVVSYDFTKLSSLHSELVRPLCGSRLIANISGRNKIEGKTALQTAIFPANAYNLIGRTFVPHTVKYKTGVLTILTRSPCVDHVSCVRGSQGPYRKSHFIDLGQRTRAGVAAVFWTSTTYGAAIRLGCATLSSLLCRERTVIST